LQELIDRMKDLQRVSSVECQ